MKSKPIFEFNPSKKILSSKKEKTAKKRFKSDGHFSIEEVLNNASLDDYYEHVHNILNKRLDKIFEKKAETLITKLKANNLY